MPSIHAVIIDDNAANLGVLSELLALEDVGFTTIQNPVMLDHHLAQLERIDLVFLDLEMPDVDGYEVFDWLKATPGLQAVPVVAYTVHTSEMTTARDLGFHSFLGKPLDADRFPDQLRRILDDQPVWEGT